MHKQKDQMAKRIAVEIFDSFGRVHPEMEVPSPDSQSMDLWYETDQPPPEQELPSYLRLPIRMGRRAAHFEFCSTRMDSRGARMIQRKQLTWDHHRYLEAKRRGQREPPLFPTWVIMPGKPVAYFRRRRVRRAPGLPLGFYCTDEESELWFVVVRELPRTRQTLVLRLLGSDKSRVLALEDIGRIPPDDLELPKLEAVVQQLRTAIEHDKTIPVDERTQFMTYARAEMIRRDEALRSEGELKGRSEGELKGRSEGERIAVYDLCQVLNIALSVRRRKKVEKMNLDELQGLREHLKKHQSWPQS